MKKPCDAGGDDDDAPARAVRLSGSYSAGAHAHSVSYPTTAVSIIIPRLLYRHQNKLLFGL